MFKPHDALDRVFEIGIIVKGFNGAAELIGGVLLLLVEPRSNPAHRRPADPRRTVRGSARLIATHLLHSANGLTGGAVLFGAIYLLTHGAVKVVLVIALLLDKLWAYPWMIGFLTLFIGYQLYRIALHPTAGLIALTIFDAVILALTVREYRRQRQHRTEWADAKVG